MEKLLVMVSNRGGGSVGNARNLGYCHTKGPAATFRTQRAAISGGATRTLPILP